jgi:hypothetical protein
MRALAGILGCGVLALVLVDAFSTLLLARRTHHVFRIARTFYWLTWNPFAAIGRRIRSSRKREVFLGIYGPLSLLVLFAVWALGLILAFGSLQWALRMQPGSLPGTLGEDLYVSASTLFTLTSGDPKNTASKVAAVIEGGLGFTFLGLVVGYLPVLYQSFSARELRISLLDARAGSPPSAGALIQFAPANPEKFETQLSVWEEWSAQVLENQLSFPMLAYFRSQHSNQAWLTALVAIVDCAAVVSLCARDDLQRQADLTFAMGRHVLADTAIVFGLDKAASAQSHGDRLPGDELLSLQRILRGNSRLFDADLCTEPDLRKRRMLYEPHAAALGDYFLMSLPSWIAGENSRGNWRVASADREEVPFAVSDPFSQSTRTEGKIG